MTTPLPEEMAALPVYTVRTFLLDTARASPGEEIDIPGDTLTAYTNGALAGIYVRLDSATNDPIPLNEFNPYNYRTGWKKFWLETTQQVGKYLRLHIGREASTEAYFQITAVAAATAFNTVRSDKDDHFTGSLAQYYKEDENISGILTNKVRITGITILSDQQLKYKLLFWYKDTFEDSDLDTDEFCGEVELDLPTYGFQNEGSGTWYLDVRNLHLDYEDLDATNELHMSLMNMSTTAKNAGATGEVRLAISYEPKA